MSPMAVLLLLLVLAYIGSMWVSSERKRAFGSPSGVEYVVLGALLGPHALGVLGHGVMAAFEPVALVALGWIGLVFGLECGIVQGRRVPLTRLVLGVLFTLVTAAAAACATFWLLGHGTAHTSDERLVESLAVGLVSVETTRHAVRWIGERQPLTGPLSDLLLDLSAADDAPVLIALAALFAQLSGEHIFSEHVRIVPAAMAAGTIGAGVALGTMSAWLIDRASSRVEGWTILLGATWLVTGMAESLGLSALAATFVLGLTLSVLGRDAPRLRQQVGQTEGAVLLPALLLAGAHLAPPEGSAEIALIALALAVRLLMNFAFGFGISLARRETRRLGPWIGAGMLASGTLTMMVGFGITLRCPPHLARPVLTIAFLGTLLGEILGPAALKQALERSSAPPVPPPPGLGPAEELR